MNESRMIYENRRLFYHTSKQCVSYYEHNNLSLQFMIPWITTNWDNVLVLQIRIGKY